jgi:transposase-like protein
MNPRNKFCPNMTCPARSKVDENNIVVQSRKVARYQCRICRKIFVATTGTPYYRLQHSAELMVIVITLIAHSCPLQAIVATFQLDKRTMMDWQERARRYCKRVHEQLVQKPRELEYGQADEIRGKGHGQVIGLEMAITELAALLSGT